MKAANLNRSPRLQRVDALLSDGKERTTLEIATKARVCAVNSAVAELRANGRRIHCERRGDRWHYRMVEAGQ